MKNKILLLLTYILFSIFNAQEFHVKYENNVSPVANVDEDLFISKQEIVSIRDSVVNFNVEYSKNISFNKNSNSIQISSKDVPHKVIYRKDVKNEKVLYVEYLNGKQYLIEDKLPPFDWKINYNSSKIINNYTCYEAKTTYRGSNIIAYFTKDISVSTGPFKFGGLPGLILEISEEGKKYNSWKAIKVDKNKKSIVTNNISKLSPISMKDFLIIENEEKDKSFLRKTSSLGKNVTVKRMKIPRQGIEKKYEWEDN